MHTTAATNKATKRTFWTIAREQIAASKVVKASKPVKASKMIEIRKMRGCEYHADVMPKQSIRLHGFEHNSVKPHAYDITFKVGDVAVYGGMNLTYTGKIVSIGEKTVKIVHHDRATVLKFDDFNVWNSNFDADKIAKHNAAWTD